MFNQSDISTWTEQDYSRLLAEVESAFLAQPGDPGFDRIKMLCGLIHDYEAIHYPLPMQANQGSESQQPVEDIASKEPSPKLHR